IHLLHLLKGTPMIKQYEKGMVSFLSQEEYTNLVADQLEVLPPEMIVHRIRGAGPTDQLIGPPRSTDECSVLNGIDDALKHRNTCQGATQEENAYARARIALR